VRELREKQALSQAQLADRVGITPHFIASIEKGLRGTTLETMLAIAQALEVPLSDLVADVDARWSAQSECA
jgi:transcriptional regulator with XRE-family HTH domain